MPTPAQRLIYAIRTRNHERLRELLQRAEVNAGTASGRTALHAAAEEGDLVSATLLLAKFQHNEPVRRQLLATGNATLVVDGNCDDFYWAESRGAGFNAFGKMLMSIRTELREEVRP